MNKKILLIIIALLILGVSIVYFDEYRYGEMDDRMMNEDDMEEVMDDIVEDEYVVDYKNIRPEELNEMLKNKDFTFINVHYPYIGEIEKTDLFIPFDQIDQNLNMLPKDKNAKIVLYCQSGGMSSVASQRLVELGYTNVMNLDGGMIDWEREGYSLIKK